MKITLNKDELNKFPMETAWGYTRLDPKGYLEGWGNWVGPAGLQHYRLLAYLSTLFNGVTIADVGTSSGGSAFALATNISNNVFSLDRVQCRSNCKSDDEQIGHLRFLIDDFHKREVMDEIAKANLILLDIQHEGPDEQYFYEELIRRDWRGVLLVDDITLNDAMKNFWESITHKKYNITQYGHGDNNSGTGLVCFDDTTVELT